MKKISMALCLVLLLSGLDLWAVSNQKIALYINGRTEVNRETVNMVYKTARKNGYNFNFSLVQSAADLSGQKFDGIVAFSTGATKGVDPAVLQFVDQVPDKSKLVLVSLLKAGAWRIDFSEAKKSKYGVDTITSATTWQLFSTPGANSTYNNPVKMHEDWISQLLSMLEKV